jgi:L,D-peptidoglycan transpeptidase YkuD (ErfK/YbiS/YcfS/YnhG family)
MGMKAKMLVIFLSWAVGLGFLEGQVPRDCDQLVVSVSDGWDGTTARMMRFERGKKGWEPVGAGPVNVLLGRNGLAWGRGVHVIPRGAPGGLKREGDGRAPAGCFAISKIYGYDRALPSGAKFPYRQVGLWDAWSDDPANPYYNRHIVVDPRNVPPWFDKAKMRHGDAAYRWLVEVRHNADPPVPGGGSAIFFHIRRGPGRKTSGCTTMVESDLVTMIRWLREKEKPHYLLLPRADYELLRASWGLPAMP